MIPKGYHFHYSVNGKGDNVSSKEPLFCKKISLLPSLRNQILLILLDFNKKIKT